MGHHYHRTPGPYYHSTYHGTPGPCTLPLPQPLPLHRHLARCGARALVRGAARTAWRVARLCLAAQRRPAQCCPGQRQTGLDSAGWAALAQLGLAVHNLASQLGLAVPGLAWLGFA